MMNTKLTQAHRSNVTAMEKPKNSELQMVSAKEKQMLGDESIGDKLNRISDANWVDPKKMRKVGNEKLDKDAFLTLMLAQMKNQDPTNPLKSHEMAAQLAQFTSLEQMQNVNTKLDDLINLQKPSSQFQALSMIGKAIESDSSDIHRAANDTSHELRFKLDKDAAEVQVKIIDEKGDRVKEYSVNNLKAGDNSITWNGVNFQDQMMRPGKYKMLVSAKDGNDVKVGTSTTVSGKITGVNYTPNGPVLLVGKQSVLLSDVRKIVEADSRPEKSREVNDVTNQALKNSTNLENNKDNVKAAPAPTQGNVDSIPMSRDLQRQLNNIKKG